MEQDDLLEGLGLEVPRSQLGAPLARRTSLSPHLPPVVPHKSPRLISWDEGTHDEQHRDGKGQHNSWRDTKSTFPDTRSSAASEALLEALMDVAQQAGSLPLPATAAAAAQHQSAPAVQEQEQEEDWPSTPLSPTDIFSFDSRSRPEGGGAEDLSSPATTVFLSPSFSIRRAAHKADDDHYLMDEYPSTPHNLYSTPPSPLPSQEQEQPVVEIGKLRAGQRSGFERPMLLRLAKRERREDAEITLASPSPSPQDDSVSLLSYRADLSPQQQQQQQPSSYFPPSPSSDLEPERGVVRPLLSSRSLSSESESNPSSPFADYQQPQGRFLYPPPRVASRGVNLPMREQAPREEDEQMDEEQEEIALPYMTVSAAASGSSLPLSPFRDPPGDTDPYPVYGSSSSQQHVIVLPPRRPERPDAPLREPQPLRHRKSRTLPVSPLSYSDDQMEERREKRQRARRLTQDWVNMHHQGVPDDRFGGSTGGSGSEREEMELDFGWNSQGRARTRFYPHSSSSYAASGSVQGVHERKRHSLAGVTGGEKNASSSEGRKGGPMWRELQAGSGSGAAARGRSARSAHKRRAGSAGTSATRAKDTKRRRRVVVALMLLVLAGLVLGLSVGLTRRQAEASGEGSVARLSTRCVDPSPGGDTGNLIAQGLVDVAANASALFTPFLDSARLALVLNRYLDLAPTSSSCANQLSLIDLGNLPSFSSSPVRVAWVQAALLWSVGMTETLSPALAAFVRGLDFDTLVSDATTDKGDAYRFSHAGYRFDFAQMTIAVPVTTWADESNPSASQRALATAPAQMALDEVATISTAASEQRTLALVHRWSELGMPASSLATFREKVQRAPILLPFDAQFALGGRRTVLDLANQAAAERSFPIGAGCFGSRLTEDQVGRINAVESTIFALPSISASPSGDVDEACLDRPLYGVLDVLNLGLPFASSDTRAGLPRHALVLGPDQRVRATLRAGELLAAVPWSTEEPSTPTSSVLLDRYGTLQHLDHVLVEYLSLVSSKDRVLARQLANWIVDNSTSTLASSSTPPTTAMELFTRSSGLKKLPTIEVQLWGGARQGQAETVLSAFTHADGTMLFGTEEGQALRAWSLGAGTPIRWTSTAEDERSLLDSSLGEVAFEQVWASAAAVTSGESVYALAEQAGLVT